MWAGCDRHAHLMSVSFLQQVSMDVSPLLVQVLCLPLGCLHLMPQIFQLRLCSSSIHQCG